MTWPPKTNTKKPSPQKKLDYILKIWLPLHVEYATLYLCCGKGGVVWGEVYNRLMSIVIIFTLTMNKIFTPAAKAWWVWERWLWPRFGFAKLTIPFRSRVSYSKEKWASRKGEISNHFKTLLSLPHYRLLRYSCGRLLRNREGWGRRLFMSSKLNNFPWYATVNVSNCEHWCRLSRLKDWRKGLEKGVCVYIYI